jgi:hypothetical protein
MKTYIVYVDGEEVKVNGKTDYLKAGSQNAAEKKAIAKYGPANPGKNIMVAYTEV